MSRIKRPKKKGYKVVFPFYMDGQYRTWSITGCERMKYEKNMTTFKQLDCGPLAVFDNLEAAINFLHLCGKYFLEIWECEYRESIHKGLWAYRIIHFNGKIIREKIEMSSYRLPNGTRLADNVKLIERVIR